MPKRSASEPSRRRVGLIATPDLATPLADAIRTCAAFELCAHAGLAKSDALPGVEWFDDTRVMIAQGGVEALVIADATRPAVELAELAAARGVHVWRTPPLARSFAEAVEILKRQAPRSTAYRLASWWDAAAMGVLDLLNRLEGFRPMFSEVYVSSDGPTLQSWKASAVDAAGGALVDAAYPMLEALLALRGLPESVSGAVARSRRKPAAQGRETEDVAAAILRYQGGGVAIIRSTWDIPPFVSRTLHHGAESSVELTGDSVRHYDGGADAPPVPLPPLDWRDQMRRFAVASQAPPQGPRVDLEHHLAVLALIEAIYLSARTGHPESPRKFYEVQGWPEPSA